MAKGTVIITIIGSLKLSNWAESTRKINTIARRNANFATIPCGKKIEFDADGNLKVKKLEAEEVEISNDNIYIKSPEKGVIMKSAGGKCFKMTVNDEGIMQSMEISCPENLSESP